MPPRPPHRPQRQSAQFGFAGVALALVLLGLLVQYFIPLLAIGVVGYGVYALATRKSALEKKNISTRLQDLKELISQCDRQIKLLESYLDAKNYTQYGILARQILPQLTTIQEEARALKNNMDIDIYKRIMKRAGNEEDNIKTQLTALNITTATPASDEEKDILTRAPEIATTYQNIQRDHLEILEKLKTAENEAELRAIHEINMKRFSDILDGYLKIKEAPKNYKNADEQLARAKAALEKFDKDLDQTLQKLNENQLSDFEISLRMMEQNHSSDIY